MSKSIHIVGAPPLWIANTVDAICSCNSIPTTPNGSLNDYETNDKVSWCIDGLPTGWFLAITLSDNSHTTQYYAEVEAE